MVSVITSVIVKIILIGTEKIYTLDVTGETVSAKLNLIKQYLLRKINKKVEQTYNHKLKRAKLKLKVIFIFNSLLKEKQIKKQNLNNSNNYFGQSLSPTLNSPLFLIKKETENMIFNNTNNLTNNLNNNNNNNNSNEYNLTSRRKSSFFLNKENKDFNNDKECTNINKPKSVLKSSKRLLRTPSMNNRTGNLSFKNVRKTSNNSRFLENSENYDLNCNTNNLNSTYIGNDYKARKATNFSSTNINRFNKGSPQLYHNYQSEEIDYNMIKSPNLSKSNSKLLFKTNKKSSNQLKFMSPNMSTKLTRKNSIDIDNFRLDDSIVVVPDNVNNNSNIMNKYSNTHNNKNDNVSILSNDYGNNHMNNLNNRQKETKKIFATKTTDYVKSSIKFFLQFGVILLTLVYDFFLIQNIYTKYADNMMTICIMPIISLLIIGLVITEPITIAVFTIIQYFFGKRYYFDNKSLFGKAFNAIISPLMKKEYEFNIFFSDMRQLLMKNNKYSLEEIRDYEE